MATLRNEVKIDAPIEKIWAALINIEELEKYDPTVKNSKAISNITNGIGAKRKVEMLDGKNWFEEKCTALKTNEQLTYELTACSFPVQSLKHSYSFERDGNSVIVKQLMGYQVKFGFLGKVLDSLMIRKQSDKGIKQFLSGLKSYTEK